MRKQFIDSIRLVAFRCIAGQLRDNNLATKSEYKRIIRDLEREKEELLFRHMPEAAHNREISEKYEKVGLDFLRVSSD